MIRKLDLAAELTMLALPFALAAIVTAIILFKRRRRARVAKEPTCGRCGYNVTGLSTFTCPECGSDLREVGIRSERKVSLKGRPSRTGLVFQLSLWGLVVILILNVCAQSLFETRWARPTEVVGQLKCITPRRPYSFVSISYNGVNKVDVRISFSSKQPLDMRADLQADRLTYLHLKADDYMVEKSGPVTPATLLAAMRAAAVDTSEPVVDRDVQALAKCLNSMGQMTPPSSSMLGAIFNRFLSDTNFVQESQICGTQYRSTGDFFLIVCGIFLVAWFGGAVPIYLRYRKRLRPHAAPAPVAADPHTPAARTLTVMFCDIQDYTASTTAAQRLAVVNLVRRHRDIVAPVANRLGGTIIKSLGDGLLLTFASATDAVRAGLEIQTAANQTDFKNTQRLPLRIGIATGEVVLVDGDVLGEAVNLASRIQQLAASGEVLFSDSTRATLHRAEVKFEDMGQKEIKGLDAPVNVYKALASKAIASV
jgi:class 3 adenylate cyclase/predicted RNA-binding Zn-ribbon protein involved in translation (DUF1610 family)